MLSNEHYFDCALAKASQAEYTDYCIILLYSSSLNKIV
jgi:hypothetical protein